MEKAVYYFISCQMLISSIVVAQETQHKTFLDDTANVIYEKSYDVNPEIDSVVIIKAKDYFSPWIVYFDKSEKNIAYQSLVHGDTVITYNYWRNGKVKQKNINLKIENGSSYALIYQESYCDNGQCIFKTPNKNHYITYYCNGNKKHEYNEINDRLDGASYWWYENGKLKSSTFHKYIFKGNISHSYPVGDWKFYDESGKLDSTQIYKNYELLQTLKH